LPDQPYNFSFSGIKGQLHQHIEQWRLDVSHVAQKIQVAYVFQEEVTEVLTEKLAKAVQSFGAKTVGVVWWVSANLRLREKIKAHPLLATTHLLLPTQFVYCTDNAAMIGVVGLMH
jgi:N6-L-threonylcarbamoyladenine synthase